MCGSMVDIQSPTAETRRGKEKKEKERRNHRAKYNTSICKARNVSKHTESEAQAVAR